MKNTNIYIEVFAGVGFVLICATARGDWAPGPEDCNLANYHYDNYACVVCSAGDTDGGCEVVYGLQNYTWKCSTDPDSGGKSGDEVWCRLSPGTKGPASRTNENSDDGCGVGYVSEAKGFTLGIYLVALFFVVAIRRRR